MYVNDTFNCRQFQNKKPFWCKYSKVQSISCVFAKIAACTLCRRRHHCHQKTLRMRSTSRILKKIGFSPIKKKLENRTLINFMVSNLCRISFLSKNFHAKETNSRLTAFYDFLFKPLVSQQASAFCCVLYFFLLLQYCACAKRNEFWI